MIISSRGRYAIRVLVDLAEHDNGQYIPMKEVAARQGISLKYLEQILPVLSQNDIVECVHGKGGGYKLKMTPEELKIGMIIKLTEGDLAPVACLGDDASPCERAEGCKTFPLWNNFHKIVNSFFDSVSLADLMKPDPEIRINIE